MKEAAKKKRFILLATIVASGTVFLDNTLINIALPAIRSDLGSAFVAMQWLVMANLLALAAVLLPGGALGDIFGKQTVFIWGCLLYAGATLTSVVAPTTGLLIAARVLMGLTAGIMVPNSLALLTEVFTGSERGKAIGTWAAWSGIFTALGPLVGGVLIDLVHWRFAFLIPIPSLLTAVVLVKVSGRECPGATADKRIDYAGSFLAAVTMALLTLSLTMMNRDAGSGALVTWSLAGGMAALGVFIGVELKVKNPMLPLSLFAIRDFAVANVITLGMYGALGGGFFMVNLYLQSVLGYTATMAGVALMPVTVAMLLLASKFGELMGTFGARIFLGGGSILVGAGWLILSFAPMEASYWFHMFPGILVFALGLSMAVPPITTVVMSSVPDASTGVASGINNALTRVASLIAVAIAGAIALAAYTPAFERLVADSSVSDKQAVIERYGAEPFAESARTDEVQNAVNRASKDGYDAALRFLAAIAVAGGLVSLVGISKEAGR